MQKLFFKSALMIVGLIASGLAISGGMPRPATPSPVVLSAAASPNAGTITISGQYFGDTLPSVKLADTTLKVKSFSATQIVADLPSNIRPATYSLTVTNSARQWVSYPFSVAVFTTASR